MTGRAPDHGVRHTAREQRRVAVLDAAARLFYERGVHEVGINEVVAGSGLSKPAVYRVFASKDELIGAYLDRLATTILASIEEDRQTSDARTAMLKILTAVEKDLGRSTFRGCPFNNASIEFDDPDHPARAVARAYRIALRQHLTELAAEVKGRPGTSLADEVAALIDGAYLNAAHLGPDGPARAAIALARRLVQEAA